MLLENSIKAVTIISILFIPISSMAEYRVYQYLVTNVNRYLNGDKSYIRNSTLDPVSFLAYHGGGQSIKVDLLRTWMCHGNTGSHQGICRSPYQVEVSDE